MASYSIRIKKSARKELESIPSIKDRQRIVSRIAGLAENPKPRGAVKMSGLDRYRIRQGRYRILYSIEDAVLTVYVIRIANRKDVYR